ncbi:MAG: c-type cytochrome, partial [Rhodospirillales bacterium]
PGPGFPFAMTLKAIVVAAAALVAVALSVAAWAAGDAARGRDKAEVCAACHGPTGNSGTPLTPSLAGQPATFVEMQLILFRANVRKVPAMQEIARPLADADIDDIAAFYAAQQPAAEPGPRRGELFRRGSELSRAMHCGQCHGREYLGGGQMPRLAGQREDYLLHAMRDYQSNARVGFDTSMIGVLYGLAERDLEALAHYLAQQ